VLLWWPRAFWVAVFVGIGFHVVISLMTPVQLFTFEMLLVYLLLLLNGQRATARSDAAAAAA
jgi:hypothetical protein